MPMRGELSTSPLASRNRPSRTGGRVYNQVISAIKNPEFGMIVLFCAVGLWLTFRFISYFPNFGIVLASLDQFP